MRKLVYLLLICLIFSGCGDQEVFETVADDLVLAVDAPLRQVLVQIPEDAAAPVSEPENGEYYLCDGWEISLQTLAAGDLDSTLRSVTGYGREELTVIETRLADVTRYDLVWTCAGETGSRVGRAAVLDDGNYHYVLSVLGDAEGTAAWQETWEALFGSYSLA